MNLKTPLSNLPGFGPVYLARLKKLFIENVWDLVHHFPSRYVDLSNVKRIAELQVDETATIRGQVWEIQNIRTRTGKFLTKAIINDGSGSINSVWFNQPYLTKSIKVGMPISLAGKVSIYNYHLSFTAPQFEIGESSNHTGRIVPIYPETEGLTSKWLRHKINLLLPRFLEAQTEYLPESVLAKHKLLGIKEALQKIHRPEKEADIAASRRRLGFEEFFLLNLASLIRRSRWQEGAGHPFKIGHAKLDWFASNLPFQLTSAQKKVLLEITADLKKTKPMNRLLLGDVGSGKTVLAAAASYLAFLNGRKTALMAPTEILAFQHAKTLEGLLQNSGMKVSVRTGSTKTSGGDLYVGTHALLNQNLEIPDLGLVVIDEQQRFGVAQRAKLREKGETPHLLSLSATPIPRTLALTFYGDLDVSVLDELPPGRQVVKTYLTPGVKRSSAYEFIRSKIKSGQQAFVITPLIEPSESLLTLKSAKAEWVRLKEEVWPELSIGLLHGRLKPKEKEGVLNDFRAGKYQILVSTPVVEVGIDIPRATVMVIEGAERFGLAQLHQLRGRIGRGQEESWCLLFTDDKTPETLTRLKALQDCHIGPKLAELDLKMRGPGEVYGLRQSGLPDLKVASLSDTDLLDETRSSAENYLASSPNLTPALKEALEPLLSPEGTPD